MVSTESKSALNPEKQRQLEERLRQAAKENRINCASAFAIAKSLGMPPAEVGKAANRLQLKISNCQLGCF